MKFKIVFSAAEKESRHEAAARFVISRKPKPTRSLVQVRFPARGMTLSYYNDQFDLHCGDLVFVDGKLESFRGHVVDVCYTFKIKLSDYKRVISVADTKVHGEFHFAGSHFVTFDRSALPYEQVITWFKVPEKEDTEIVSGQDGSGFQLNDLQTTKISDTIAESGDMTITEKTGCGTSLWIRLGCGPLWKGHSPTSWNVTTSMARSEIWFATVSALTPASICSPPCCS